MIKNNVDAQAIAEIMSPVLGRILAEHIRSIVQETFTKELRHQRRTVARSDGLMTLAQAADYLRVSPKTVCKMRSEGKIKGELIGKRWRYRAEALEAAVKSPWLT